MNGNVNEKNLKIIFLFCLLLIILLIIIRSIDFEKIENNNSQVVENGNINVSSYQKFEKLNYNNLSSLEKDYISSIYSGNVRFTENGVEVYNESSTSGKLRKIITSAWPTSEIGSFIPVAEYGELNRIEYSENWIEVYISNAKQSDVKDYLKLLKEYNFTKNEEKDDGKIMLEYKVYNELGECAIVRFMKGNETLEIRAEK